MRHRVGGYKLKRPVDSRNALLRNLCTSVILEERVITTVPKAKAVKPLVEKMITLAKDDTLQSRRQAASYLLLPAVTQKLFSEIAPKFGDRAGGYTRIIRAGNRVGDNAKVAILEIIGYQYKEKEKKEKASKEEPAEAAS